MITVNNRTSTWVEGLTVQEVLTQNNFVYANILVRVNGVNIAKENYATTIIEDGDKVLALHMFGGG